MTDQVRIGDDGSLEIERTWDGEPLYSPATVQEGLFAGDAFQQMPGQTVWDLTICASCGQDFFNDPDYRYSYCSVCMGSES